MAMDPVVDRHLLTRIRMEYVEMPGLQLTSRQARRLWNLDETTCDGVLAMLVEEQFLSRTTGGTYLRRGAGRYGPPVTIGSRHANSKVVAS